MSEKLQRFTKLLRDMFELEKSDLDFGIYRIMNIRKNEINNFIENTLSGEVSSILSKYATDNSEVRKRIEEIEKQCQSVGVKVEDSKLREEYAEYKVLLDSGTGVTELESDVYSALYNFFSRYYDEGDFISKRRYKEGVYGIPYEGEEVKLYWANHDQYYIKTSENFRDYSFKVDVQGVKFTIHFKLVDADTEQNNNKESDDKKREFILLNENFLEANGNELIIRLEYRLATKEQDDKNKLKDNSKLNKSAVDKIKDAVSGNADFKRFIWAVNAPAPTEKNKTRTILEKHLEAYVAKNTFDYFIHKDLRGFLNRELDFYIKSEIMHLDDLDTDNEVKVNAYLAKVKAIKKVGRIIIDFLAQIEEFQKKLWLKKKLVVETNWCITLDKIDESFYPEIASNDAQRQEWVELYAIDEIAGDLMSVAYSNPLTIEFLEQNKNLMLDTKHFSKEFTERLIASIDNLDEKTNGLMIHSENFQALNLLQERYREQVQCIYIDPPYNTNASEILYKNGYKHSSWSSLMRDRLLTSRFLMKKDAIMCVTIDDFELHRLWHIVQEIFGDDNELGTALIRNNPQGRSTLKGFAVNHEFALFFANSESVKSIGRLEHSQKQKDRYSEIDEKGIPFLWENFRKTGTDSNRADRPKQFYPIYTDGAIIQFAEMEWDEINSKWNITAAPQGLEVIWPISDTGEEKVWKWGIDRAKANTKDLKVEGEQSNWQIYRKNYINEEGSLPGTWWDKPKYAAGSHGTNLLTDFFGVTKKFSFPKSVYAVEDCLRVSNEDSESIILDYFAGSGTTGHAVIDLNREDNGNRKYILVEMGNYFNTVTKPRIKKAVYSKDWKDGKPQNRNNGISQIFKYVWLESYEDTLNNIDLVRSAEQEGQFRQNSMLFNEYLVSYMLDIESRGSLLSLERFKAPFDYKMNIVENNEMKETNIDLVETFNYLLGLTVLRQSAVNRFNAAPDNKGQYENAVKLVADKEGKYAFKQIEGIMPNGDKALIIWRNLSNDLAADNAALDAFFTKHRLDPKDNEFDIMFVNGDNNLENLRKDSERWKVNLIEIEFGKRMFEGA